LTPFSTLMRIDEEYRKPPAFELAHPARQADAE
jgi:hypothetical protein